MSDERTRAWRAAFCIWAGESFLAAMCAAVGGPLGILLVAPTWFPLGLPAACLAFVAGLAVAAVFRALLGKVERHSSWMAAWVVFGALIGIVWIRKLFHL